MHGLKIRQLVSPVFEHQLKLFRMWTGREASASFPIETENMISRLGAVASIRIHRSADSATAIASHGRSGRAESPCCPSHRGRVTAGDSGRFREPVQSARPSRHPGLQPNRPLSRLLCTARGGVRHRRSITLAEPVGLGTGRRDPRHWRLGSDSGAGSTSPRLSEDRHRVPRHLPVRDGSGEHPPSGVCRLAVTIQALPERRGIRSHGAIRAPEAVPRLALAALELSGHFKRPASMAGGCVEAGPDVTRCPGSRRGIRRHLDRQLRVP